jgi:lipocalin-like protein
MNRRQAIGMVGFASAMQARPAALDGFVGVWGLISFQRKLEDGRIIYPYGEKPVGRITYDKAGRMSAQLMRPGRRSTVPPGVALIAGNASCEEIHEAVDGFIAYFGTFDVDESARTVIHHVQACLVPSWVGTDLKRTYRFSANRLVLTAIYTTSVLELVWQRELD